MTFDIASRGSRWSGYKIHSILFARFWCIDTMCNGWNVLGEENIEIMSEM